VFSFLAFSRYSWFSCFAVTGIKAEKKSEIELSYTGVTLFPFPIDRYHLLRYHSQFCNDNSTMTIIIRIILIISGNGEKASAFIRAPEDCAF
jgi:hypothetical protein